MLVKFEILLGKKILENFKLGQTISLFFLVFAKKKSLNFMDLLLLKKDNYLALLIQVNGLGPKAAQRIVSHYSYDYQY